MALNGLTSEPGTGRASGRRPEGLLQARLEGFQHPAEKEPQLKDEARFRTEQGDNSGLWLIVILQEDDVRFDYFH
jgi:hypothetical protein